MRTYIYINCRLYIYEYIIRISLFLSWQSTLAFLCWIIFYYKFIIIIIIIILSSSRLMILRSPPVRRINKLSFANSQTVCRWVGSFLFPLSYPYQIFKVKQIIKHHSFFSIPDVQQQNRISSSYETPQQRNTGPKTDTDTYTADRSKLWRISL